MIERLNILCDEREIVRLVTGFVFRDQQRWEELSALFWEDAQLAISWFSGAIDEFIDQSKKMAGNSAVHLKHMIGQPRIDCMGDRAIGDTDLCIMLRAPVGTRNTLVDIMTWARFIDRFERRQGVWKIARRIAIYEKDRADPVGPGETVEWDTPKHVSSQFPAAYRNLATMLSDLGREEMMSAISAGSAEERALFAEQCDWLAQS